MTVPAPPTAYFAKCWKCQSLAMPSASATYICMGPMTMRLGNVTSRNLKGLNSSAGGRGTGVMGGMLLSPRHQSGALARYRGADLLAASDGHSRWCAPQGSWL